MHVFGDVGLFVLLLSLLTLFHRSRSVLIARYFDQDMFNESPDMSYMVPYTDELVKNYTFGKKRRIRQQIYIRCCRLKDKRKVIIPLERVTFSLMRHRKRC